MFSFAPPAYGPQEGCVCVVPAPGLDVGLHPVTEGYTEVEMAGGNIPGGGTGLFIAGLSEGEDTEAVLGRVDTRAVARELTLVWTQCGMREKTLLYCQWE